ncbi:hypothetical protein [Mycolicibacterium litorale]|uniref:hypothetical protein n=1 Tax=Mycolicibacterium litorale TaxID=758802 RepID=UPI0039A215E8
MQAAVRSYVTAGVALAGVGAIALSPVAPMPDVEVPAISSSPAVELNALVNPIEVFAPVFEKAFEDVGGLGQRVFADPAPILQQIVANQIASAQTLGEIAGVFGESFRTALAEAPGRLGTAVEQLSAGEITAALNTLFDLAISPVIGPLLDSIFSGDGVLQDLVGVLQQPFANAENVIGLLGDQDFLLTIGLVPLQTVYALNTAVGGAAEALLAAAEAGDPEAFVNAITEGGAGITAAVLDRLLNPGTAPYRYDQGIIGALLSARDMIAQALGAPAPTRAAVKTVTLDVETTPETTNESDDVAAGDVSALDAGVAAPDAAEPAASVDEDTAAVEGGDDELADEPVSAVTKRTDPLDDLRKGFEGAVDDVRNGFKHAAAGLAGKANKPAKAETSSDSADGSPSPSSPSSSSEGDSASADAQ